MSILSIVNALNKLTCNSRCEHIRFAQCNLREAIPPLRLLRAKVYPE